MTRRSLALVSDTAFSYRHPAHARVKTSSSRTLDPRWMRAAFADVWAGWLAREFDSREEVAVAFRVTFQTACNWWDGTTRPSGDKVFLAMLDPAYRAGLEAELARVAEPKRAA